MSQKTEGTDSARFTADAAMPQRHVQSHFQLSMSQKKDILYYAMSGGSSDVREVN